MASKINMKTAGVIIFNYLLDDLELAKYEQPELYDALAKIITKERGRIAETLGIDNLPPVPTKDEK
ncbi:MAG: hypothetical protein LBN42_03030 [Oscillospiraceae bacterium]|jgi:hypothetical protein|nr:hypothetical protein [Oscillospiraceae bacterium]